VDTSARHSSEHLEGASRVSSEELRVIYEDFKAHVRETGLLLYWLRWL
jgi:hypothetical protein